jgi:hypothetical protein
LFDKVYYLDAVSKLDGSEEDRAPSANQKKVRRFIPVGPEYCKGDAESQTDLHGALRAAQCVRGLRGGPARQAPRSRTCGAGP